MSSAQMTAVQRRVQAAIQIGAPLYNAGDIAGCEAVYRSLYDDLLADPSVGSDPRLSAVLREQMAKLRPRDPDHNAWQLRFGMDAIVSLDASDSVSSWGSQPSSSDSVPMAPPPLSLQAVRQRIMAAIEIGAPRYNAGDVAGCAAVYRSLYDDLLGDPSVAASPAVSSILRARLAALLPGNDKANAWQLRHGMDEVLAMPGGASMGPSAAVFLTTTPTSRGGVPLLTLTDPTASMTMQVVNDGVMGGVSSGQVLFSSPDQATLFTGTLRTENNGGFASIRRQGMFPDLRPFSHLIVDCRTNTPGKTFHLVVKDASALASMTNFKAPFQAPTGAFDRVSVPLSAFGVPERFGRPVNRPPMNWSQLREVGFMILKPEVGDFSLWIRSVDAQ